MKYQVLTMSKLTPVPKLAVETVQVVLTQAGLVGRVGRHRVESANSFLQLFDAMGKVAFGAKLARAKLQKFFAQLGLGPVHCLFGCKCILKEVVTGENCPIRGL